MGSPDKKLLGIVKFWGPRKTESANVSRDFWMPDQSCRVCYECDSQFTVFNRRHHCRLCGRVFCAKCTAHSIPIPSDEPKSDREDVERLRVCNYCFRQWEQGLVTINHEVGGASSPGLSPSPSAASLGSISSSFTANSSTSTVGSNSMAYSTGPYEHVVYDSSASVEQPSLMGQHIQDNGSSDPINLNTFVDVGDLSSNSNQHGFGENSKSDDEENACGEYYGAVNFNEIDQLYGSYKGELEGEEGSDRKEFGPLSHESSEAIKPSPNESAPLNYNDESEASLYGNEPADVENLDFENDWQLWIPPEPEDEDDDREADYFDDEEDGDDAGEWGYASSSSSLPGGDLPQREKSIEEHRKAMRNVVGGHFRALITQLLQVENIAVSEEYDKENWLDIITSLSWEAASLLKPDMSKGSGMDPGGYVKVKCLACGRPSDSMVVKGVVCKKNVAHRRMTSKIDRPRLLILGGALEYQRVSNHLSSFDTLLQQEMDHLKMAVAKIDSHHPNILLVEKSVSRFAQEYLLAKSISLVLNLKRPLLERIARCTGAQIVPSIDHLKSPKLGFCESFHVEKYFEDHGSAGQGGKKMTKTLMFFEGCPKPLGFTILLRGASGDELKKVKHVVQYGVFAAYHLALETSYLADEGASLPELPLKSPITVALPDKPLSINRSISTVPILVNPTSEKPQHENVDLPPQLPSSVTSSFPKSEFSQSSFPTKSAEPNLNLMQSKNAGSLPPVLSDGPNSMSDDLFQDNASELVGITVQIPERHSALKEHDDTLLAVSSSLSATGPSGGTMNDGCALVDHDPNNSGVLSEQNCKEQNEKEDFPTPTSDGQSILVSLTTRCVWKGVVCERAHLFRIKYYRSFDKPLGRFLQDDLFDQNYRCRSCEEPSEAHIHCYTHQQGSLIISVRKLAEFPLPGEREGKIWMWHRCLRCPRVNGFPRATKRVAMSDAAWGLSFGKFLELSFSNHAAASRVASCGHSLHKDCLRFYGCGQMVACFRYSPIVVHSVYLPPSKLGFPWYSQEWILNEANEVSNQGELLFTEVRNAINQISEKLLSFGALESNTTCGLRNHIMELERILGEEKEEFEESLQKALQTKPGVDILDINKLRRRLLFQSYIWDQRLKYTSTLDANKLQHGFENLSKPMEEHSKDAAKTDTNVGTDSDESSHHRSSSGEKKSSEEVICKTEGAVSQNGIKIGEVAPVHPEGVVRRVVSTVQFPVSGSLSDTLEAAWIGEGHSGKENDVESSSLARSVTVSPNSEKGERDVSDIRRASSFMLPAKGTSDSLDNIYKPFGKSTSLNIQKLGAFENYSPVFVYSLRDLERVCGARLLLPVGVNDTVIPVYDDEPTSAISYALASQEYQKQLSVDLEMKSDGIESAVSLPLFNSANFLPLYSPVDTPASVKNFGTSEESLLSMSLSRGSVILDPLFYAKALHAKIPFTDNGSLGKVNYNVTCYYAKRFEALRNICCPSELDYIRSLSRCKKWGAKGGKSNVFFAKTLDDRFIIKQVTKTELESFNKFAPAYFKYLSESISSGGPTCLAKILGIYQVTSKHLKGGKESKIDVLVMENLLFQRNVTRLYDLKGSCRSRYNPDTSAGYKVLLDQNLIETMPTSPIFVGNKAKRLLERAVWNDTSFLASIDVMDYSLLVGIDEEKHELVVGIIDFMRQYTWDKHLETWVKASRILGGPNAPPTVISPDQYKKRFRKAMTTYFLMVPDQWSPPTIIPAMREPLSDNNDDSSRNVASP